MSDLLQHYDIHPSHGRVASYDGSARPMGERRRPTKAERKALLRWDDDGGASGAIAWRDPDVSRSRVARVSREQLALSRWADDGGALLASPPRPRTLPPPRPEPMALWRWEDDGGASL